MSTSTIASLIQTAVGTISDTLVSALPYVLGLAGSILAVFVVWRFLRRFLSR